MTKEICSQLFENLYDNKVILRKGTICFCEFLQFDFNDNILTVQLRVLEPVVKLKMRHKAWFEQIKEKEYIEIQYNFLNNKAIKIEQQSIGGPYSSRIWANHDIVKKIFELKEQNLEEEIYEILW